MIGTIIWMSQVVLHYLVTIFLFKLINKDNLNETNINNKITNITKLLESAYSFFEIVDSKLVGLCIFLIANIFIFVINLNINAKNFSDFFSLIILSMYSFASVSIPFLGYYYLFFKKRCNFSN